MQIHIVMGWITLLLSLHWLISILMGSIMAHIAAILTPIDALMQSFEVVKGIGLSDMALLLTALGTLALALTTYMSLGKLKEQIGFMRSQSKVLRLVEEMERLIAPCYVGVHSFEEGRTAFDMTSFAGRRDIWENSAIFKFIDDLIKYKYLSSSSKFTSALNEYLDARESYWKERAGRYRDEFEATPEGSNLRADFEAKKTNLFLHIDTRFEELDAEIEREKKNLELKAND